MILERLYKRMQRRLLQSIVSLSYDQLEDFVGRFRPPFPPPPPIYSSIFTREATGRLLTKLQTWLSHSVLATLYG